MDDADGRARAQRVLDEHPLLEQRLRRRYAVPPRSYHTFAHAADVASRAADLGGERACLLAAWFHDAVYEPRADDNEERSALLLEEWLGQHHDVTVRAAALVRMTAHHAPPPGDAQAAILSDADLAVLGGDPDEYERYRAAVRAEYAHLGDAAWATGRAAVLDDLLGRERLFATEEGRRRWQDAARRNMAAERSSLSD